MLTVYLANLIHIQNDHNSPSDSIPLNIGYLAAYLNANFNEKIDIQLFNHPDKLESAIDKKIPNILASSNYVWNSQLNYMFLAHYKSRYPKVVTVMGGAHYPGNTSDQEVFLRNRYFLDFYIDLEGEETFLKLVERLVKHQFNVDSSKQKELQGCQFLYNDNLFDGGRRKRKKDLDEIPSPYLEGWLDEFLKDGCVPILQTNRGCPFKCAFCHSGDLYFNKLSQFYLDRVLQEIEYIASRTNSHSLNVSDNNFGILKRDEQISQKLADMKEKYGWPLNTVIDTSKTNKRQVADSISPIKHIMMINLSVQSMNPDTLTAIKRKNLSFGEFQEITNMLDGNQIRSATELIVPMPEETVDTLLQSIKTSVDSGIDDIGLYTTMLLPSTPFTENPYYDQFDMIKKYRVVPKGFGEYSHKKVIETEAVCIATSTISAEEYYKIRGLHFVVHSLYNTKLLKEIVLYLRSLNISIFKWLQNIQQHLEADAGVPGEIYQQFLLETKNELWDSEDEIYEYYNIDENYQNLINGETGSNLLMKYSLDCLQNLDYVGQIALQVLLDTEKTVNAFFLKDLLKYCISKRWNIFEKSEYQINESFLFDIEVWKNSDEKGNIEKFMNSVNIKFSITEEQQRIIGEYTNRYGNSKYAKGLILAKAGPENLFRQESSIQKPQDH